MLLFKKVSTRGHLQKEWKMVIVAEPENMPCREVSIKSPGLQSGFRMLKNITAFWKLEFEEFHKPKSDIL